MPHVVSGTGSRCRVGLTDGSSRILFCVQDNGPGIPPADAERIKELGGPAEVLSEAIRYGWVLFAGAPCMWLMNAQLSVT